MREFTAILYLNPALRLKNLPNAFVLKGPAGSGNVKSGPEPGAVQKKYPDKFIVAEFLSCNPFRIILSKINC
jgi:hypothetical protein